MGAKMEREGSEAKAHNDPVSAVSPLRLTWMLMGCSQDQVLHSLYHQSQGNPLNSASFGRPVVTADKEKPRFRLGVEEAFYLHYYLKCLEISSGDKRIVTDHHLW